jgi:hypothetical protein
MSPGYHGLLLAWLLAWADPFVASNLQDLLAPLLVAREGGRAGQVVGSLALEPKTPQGPATPLPGAVLALLPHSPDLVRGLEDFKAKARESEAGYFGAAAEVARLKERYERALGEAGAGDLVFSEASDARGEFVFSRVPAGEWLLLGRHETFHRVPAQRARRREREVFRLDPPSVGYRAVTYWLTQVSVKEGGVARVELTDRNPWLRGVLPEREKSGR